MNNQDFNKDNPAETRNQGMKILMSSANVKLSVRGLSSKDFLFIAF